MPEPKTLRRDARINRERLVAAARTGLAEEGASASLEGIAARAGVGIGTLYRHFPTREALVEAVFDDRVGEWLAAAEDAAAREDAWEGLCAFLERTLELQAAHRALHEAFVQNLPGDGRLSGVQAELRDRLELLLRRAHEQGSLRPDYTVADLTLLFWSLGPVVDATAAVAPGAARRHLAFVLDGLRAGPAIPPLAEPPLTDAELAAARRTLRASRYGRPAAVRAARA